MSNIIKLKRGLSSNISDVTLEQGELAVTTDTNELYVGTTSGNTKLNGGGSSAKFPFYIWGNENIEQGTGIRIAEYGMTFRDWVDSSYNTEGFIIKDDYFMAKEEYGSMEPVPTFHYYDVITPYNPVSSIQKKCMASNYILPGVIISYCCFLAGSQVLVSLDGETKNIEELKENDQIVIYNEDTKQFELSTISKHITKQGVTDQAQVILENDTSVTMNAYHPLLTTEGYHSITNFEGLPTLTENDTLVTTNGNIKIKEIIRTTIEPTTMYNLSVNGIYHNFIVNSIVSHNAPSVCNT